MQWRLKSLLVICATCVAGWAAADPIVYEFEGFILNRSVQAGLTPPDTDKYLHLPAGFVPGTKFNGRMTYDRDVRYFDAEASEERAAPVTNIWLRTDAGAYLSRVGSAHSGGVPVDSMTADRVIATSILNQVTDNGEFRATLNVSWEGPDSELAAPRVGRITLIAMEPDCVVEHCARREYATGYITRAGKARSPAWNTVSWNFAANANGWTPKPGTTWTVVNGYYRNTSNIEASMALSSMTIAGDFAFDASVYLEWTSSGNRGGLIYDYRDDRNYRGVLVSSNTNTSTSSGQPGVLEVFEVSNGVRRVVSSRSQARYRHTWSPISVSRVNGVTRVNDVEVMQSPIHGGRVGLLARWNMVRFDDVVLARPRSN